MPITFADVPLLMEDPEGRLASWLEHYLSLENVRLFGEQPLSWWESRWQSRSGARARVNLPLPNWPAPPKPRINTLWWPTGASRWARGLFLADTERTEAIVAAAKANDASFAYSYLELTDVRSGAAAPLGRARIPMYLLPPRPITATAGPGNCWLVPLVDQRYFWQYKDAATLTIDDEPATTWADVFQALASALGISLTIDSNAYEGGGYGTHPDRLELGRTTENAAVLLDAVAWTVGHRIVVRLDGGVESVNAATSTTRRTGNLTSAFGAGYPTLAGGTARTRTPLYPEKIKIVFPRSRRQYLRADGATYEVVKDTEDYFTSDEDGFLQQFVRGTTKTFFSTAYADTDGDPSTGGDPDNLGAIESLAGRIARDFVEYLPIGDDVQLAGLCFGWLPTGFDDGLLLEIGSQFERGTGDDEHDAHQYRYSTRIIGLPPDVGTSHLLHQWIPFAEVVQPSLALTPFRLQGHLTPEGTANATQLVWDSSADSGDGGYANGDTVTVRETLDRAWALQGETIWCQQVDSDNGPVWEVVIGGLQWYHGTLTEPLNSGSTAKVYVQLPYQAIEITSRDKFLRPGAVAPVGYPVGVTYSLTDREWITTEARCS